MTNEELRTKIVEILEETEYEWTEEKNGYILQIFYDKLADALIAAGIGDVSELKKHRVIVEQSPVPTDDNCYILPNTSPIIKQLYSGKEVEQIAKERDEYKHRAARAEKALDLCETAYILSLNHRATEGISGQAIASDLGVHKFFIKQAEKELAEERKDD